MRKWEWVKTILAAAAAAALILFLGDRDAFYHWIEALIYIGILAGGFYGGLAFGACAGGLLGLLRWFIIGGELFQVVALFAGGVCCAFFGQLGKGASCLAFLSGTAVCYLLFDVELPPGVFETLVVALAVFLIVSPGKKRDGRNKFGSSKFGSSRSGIESNRSGAVRGRIFKKIAEREHAAAVAPEKMVLAWDTAEAEGRMDFAAFGVGQGWRRLAENFMALARCFDDQSLLVLADEEDCLTAAEWKQRFLESRQTICLQFAQIGEVILKQQQRNSSFFEVTERYGEKIERQLRMHRIYLKQLQVMENVQGRQEIFARISCKRGVHLSAQEAASFFRTDFGRIFCPAYDCRSVISVQEGNVHLIEKQKFKVLYGLARKQKTGENCSGDSFSARLLGEERMLLCLSDGMGTGKKAGLESKMAVELLEQLLENGFSIPAAVNMVNQILLNGRYRQTPTTLDICLFDLYSGSCQFAKMGAAVGYLKRGNSVSAIRGQSVPLGMISCEKMDYNMVPEEMVPEEQLQSGDMLVMMTDGVSEKAGLASDEILKELISRCTICNAGEMAEWLMEQLMLLDDTIQDDMTILAAGIWKK